jgi:hypothetical protein
MKTKKYKDHIVLLLDSGELQAVLITAHELHEHAFKEMGDENTDESDALCDYVESNLETNSAIGWTDLDLSTDKVRLKALASAINLQTLIAQVN